MLDLHILNEYYKCMYITFRMLHFYSGESTGFIHRYFVPLPMILYQDFEKFRSGYFNIGIFINICLSGFGNSS